MQWLVGELADHSGQGFNWNSARVVLKTSDDHRIESR
jgi:hypothetical protein